MNSIGNFIEKIGKNSSEFQQEIGIINGYLKRKNVNYELGLRIHKYLEYIWHGEKLMKSTEEMKIINKLSQNLKEELFLEAHGDIIKNSKFFSKNFSKNFMQSLSFKIEEVQLTPNEVVYHKGDFKDKSIYFLRSGDIELFIPSIICSNF